MYQSKQNQFRQGAAACIWTLVSRIDSAMSSGSKADILVAFGEVREYAQRVLAAEVSQAERNYGDFPFPEFKEVFDGRQRQLLSCPTFFDEISRRFRNESGRKQLDEQESWIVGGCVGVTLPSSESIIGPHLGIPGPAFACHHCGEDGHWRGECPAFWGSKDLPLPGWRRNGRKDRNAWDGENPKKETFKAWVRFIKDNFDNKGQPARVDGAPAFDDYKDRAV
ncbi:MAG: hypothetical protein EBZ67_17025, partial [Chitinophagia bacterium]|nr:hypothetical protein [Chitinophagia bacterium]